MFHLLSTTWPGPLETMLLGGLALLILGKRLPQWGRAVGQGIVDFRRALRDAENDITRNPADARARNRKSEQGHDENEREFRRDLLLVLITAAIALALLCIWLSHIGGEHP